jgi:glucose-6-phosphate dehydrogenase assembly protein OpcA
MPVVTRDGLVSLGRTSPAPLDLPALRRDLAALWREEGKAGAGVTRACQATLAVPAGPEDDLEPFLEEVVRVHPSRAILVREDPSRGAGEVAAWVSAWCRRRPDGKAMVCSEVLHVDAGPSSESRVASAVRSLAVGGLPLVVLGEVRSPLEVPWIVTLGSSADAVIGNSNRLSVPEGIALWRRSLDADTRPPTTDAAWIGLVDWRCALALHADPPRVRDRLAALDRVTIAVAPRSGGTLKAWLLTGWLASRLGWTYAESLPAGGSRWTRPGGAVDVVLREESENTDGALLMGVTLEGGGGSPLVWRRRPHERAIVIEEGGEHGARHWLSEAKTRPADVVDERLRRRSPDPVEREALAAAVRIGEGARERGFR